MFRTRRSSIRRWLTHLQLCFHLLIGRSEGDLSVISGDAGELLSPGDLVVLLTAQFHITLRQHITAVPIPTATPCLKGLFWLDQLTIFADIQDILGLEKLEFGALYC